MVDHDPHSTEIAVMLVEKTTYYRSKIKEETGTVLSVGDTMAALAAFEDWLHSRPVPDDLTDLQKELLRLFVEGVVEIRQR